MTTIHDPITLAGVKLPNRLVKAAMSEALCGRDGLPNAELIQLYKTWADSSMGMLLTGRRVPAAEGLELGFVNEVVAAGEALAGARRWAEQIVECAPLSVRGSKQAAMDGLDKASLEEAIRGHYPVLGDMFKSEDFIEGPLAFAQKRRPNWKGR